ncbi:MAG: hypothetical protein ACYC6M_04265 [Terriglobales bacterium]
MTLCRFACVSLLCGSVAGAAQRAPVSAWLRLAATARSLPSPFGADVMLRLAAHQSVPKDLRRQLARDAFDIASESKAEEPVHLLVHDTDSEEARAGGAAALGLSRINLAIRAIHLLAQWSPPEAVALFDEIEAPGASDSSCVSGALPDRAAYIVLAGSLAAHVVARDRESWLEARLVRAVQSPDELAAAVNAIHVGLANNDDRAAALSSLSAQLRRIAPVALAPNTLLDTAHAVSGLECEHDQGLHYACASVVEATVGMLDAVLRSSACPAAAVPTPAQANEFRGWASSRFQVARPGPEESRARPDLVSHTIWATPDAQHLLSEEQTLRFSTDPPEIRAGQLSALLAEVIHWTPSESGDIGHFDATCDLLRSIAELAEPVSPSLANSVATEWAAFISNSDAVRSRHPGTWLAQVLNMLTRTPSPQTRAVIADGADPVLRAYLDLSANERAPAKKPKDANRSVPRYPKSNN